MRTILESWLKTIDDWLGTVFGIAGGGVAIVQSHSLETAIRITMFILSSIAAGFLGVAGKYLFLFVRKKIIKLCENLSRKP